jgi:predicted kinase
MYVVVSGPPASGKSTLARELAELLDLPLLAKDEFKQGMLDDQPVEAVEDSRVTGRKAVLAMLSSARAAEQGVLDSVWVDRERARDEIAGLQRIAGVVEVFCRCEVDTMRRRYRERAPTKAPGHFDDQRLEDELWPSEALGPLAGPWPVVEVDTSGTIDVLDVASRVRRTRSRR